MLRDDYQSARQDLLVKLQESALHCREAGAHLEGGERALCEQLAQEHEHLAQRVETCLRRDDELPQTPDSDREWLHGLADELRARLTRHPARDVLAARLDEERQLLEQVQELLELCPVEDQPLYRDVGRQLEQAGAALREIIG